MGDTRLLERLTALEGRLHDLSTRTNAPQVGVKYDGGPDTASVRRIVEGQAASLRRPELAFRAAEWGATFPPAFEASLRQLAQDSPESARILARWLAGDESLGVASGHAAEECRRLGWPDPSLP